jgi:hypothetical protein
MTSVSESSCGAKGTSGHAAAGCGGVCVKSQDCHLFVVEPWKGGGRGGAEGMSYRQSVARVL